MSRDDRFDVDEEQDPLYKARALRKYHESYLRKKHGYEDDDDYGEYQRYLKSHHRRSSSKFHDDDYDRKFGSLGGKMNELETLEGLDEQVDGIEKKLSKSLN